MKADIHPQLHPVVFVDTSTGAEFITASTLTTDQKKKIGGVDHYIIKVEISSASHPFYTGKRKLVDTAGRVDKFIARAKKAQEIQEKKVKVVDKELDELIHEEKKAEVKEEKEEVKEEKEEIKEEKPKKESTPKKTTAKKSKASAKKAAPKAKKAPAKKAAPKAKKKEEK